MPWPIRAPRQAPLPRTGSGGHRLATTRLTATAATFLVPRRDAERQHPGRGEPGDITAAAAALGRDEELVVPAPFEPVPLKCVPGSQGSTCDAAGLGNGDWQVTFRHPS